MFKKFALVALPALALSTGFAGAAFAADHSCEASVKEVQATWEKMYPMAMQENGNQGINDALRMAKEKCAEGDVVATQQYLNVVRGHLDMPAHPAPHDQK
jgi:hypothetical protein